MSEDFVSCFSGVNISSYLLDEQNITNTYRIPMSASSTVEHFQDFDLDVPY